MIAISKQFAGFFALFAREVKRFQKIWLDTVVSPLMSLILYLAVFGVVVGQQSYQGISYTAFVYAGLLAMTMINASFSNPSFALIISKNLGTIIDLQLAPLSPIRIGLAYALAATVRGLLTVIAALLLTGWFVDGIGLAHPLVLIAGLFLTGGSLGLLGVAFGVWAKNFEALTFATTFIMQPLIFLSGVFYPISNLPAQWGSAAAFNPFHHLVNLLRYGLTGAYDGSVQTSFIAACALFAVALGLSHYLVSRKLKAG